MAHILEHFNLYHRMLEECNDKLETINLITSELNNLKFILEDVDYFINNYTKIEYNDKNINKYCELVFKFGLYSMDDKFIDHIVDTYVFSKHKLLHNIVNYEQFICNILSKLTKKNKYTDHDIFYIIKHINVHEIQQLNAANNRQITDSSIKHLYNLKYLDATYNIKITDLSIKHLTGLTSLNANFNSKISSDSIKYLKNLVVLEASYCNISRKNIKHLTKLKII